jgi:hypothetical protein
VKTFEGVKLTAVRVAALHIKSARNSERLDEYRAGFSCANEDN